MLPSIRHYEWGIQEIQVPGMELAGPSAGWIPKTMHTDSAGVSRPMGQCLEDQEASESETAGAVGVGGSPARTLGVCLHLI